MALSRKKHELDWMDLAFCAMVLFSHCSGHPITHLRTDSWQFALFLLAQRLTYVSVYGFFVLSGIKLALPRSRPIQWGKWFMGRVKALFIPYLAANVVYYVFYCWVIRWYAPSWEKFLGYLLHGNLVSPFYFLIILFQLTLLSPALLWVSKKLPAWFILPLALVVSWGSEVYLAQIIEVFIPGYWYPWGDRTFTTYIFYYLAGCYIGGAYEQFTGRLKGLGLPVAGAFLVTAGWDLVLLYRLRVLGAASPWVPWAHLSYILAAIAFCFWLALRLDRPLPPLLAKVSGAGFLIYLYHSLLISMLDWVSLTFGISDVGLLFAVRVPLIYIGTPALCIAWQELVKKVKKNST